MPPNVRTPKEAWLQAGLEALATSGPDAVRVEVLATTLGVTKGGFYGHFTDREQFLNDMLDSWERQSTDEAVALAEDRGGSPQARARRAGLRTFSEQLLPIDLAIRDWARRDAKVAARLRRVDDRRMAYLRTQFGAMHPRATPVETEARCLLAFSMLIGDHLITARHPRMKRADVMAAAGKLLESE